MPGRAATKLVWTVLVTPFLASCIGLNLKYEAEIETQNGDELDYVYEDVVSTPVEGVACGLTAIYYGGACWIFLFLPYDSDVKEFARDARRTLRKKLKKRRYSVVSARVWENGWNNFNGLPFADLRLRTPVARRKQKEEPAARRGGEEGRKEQTGRTPKPALSRPTPFELHVGGDVGSSFSPHGIGGTLAFQSYHYMLELGYGGWSKGDVLGRPWSATLLFIDGLWYGGAGMTQYRGEGKQTIVYESGHHEEDVETRWNLSYGHLTAGTIYNPLKDSRRLAVRLEGGLSYAFSANIDTESEADYTNLGVRGIKVSEVDPRPYLWEHEGIAEQGDWGPYIRAVLTYQVL